MTSNSAAYELLGLPEGSNSSKSATDNPAVSNFRILKDGVELMPEELPVQLAAATGRAQRNVELQVERNESKAREIFGHAVPLLDDNGKVRGAVGSFVDVTEMKQAERELEKSNALFRALFESDVIGFLISSLDGRCINSNDAFLRMVGYTREEMEAGAVRWLEMTPPEFLHLDYKGVAEVNERGSCVPYEKEYIRKDGTRVPILLGYTNLRGTSDHYVSFILDLSTQRTMEKELQKSEQQFRALADSLPQLVYVLDANGNREYCNEPFYTFTGFKPDDEITRNWNVLRLSIVHPDDLEQVQANWVRCRHTGEEYYNEVRVRRHDGKYRTFLTRAVPVKDQTGKVVRWVASAMDAHDHKVAEEALRRSEKLAAASRLASSIAHEINNPLQAMSSLLYLMSQESSLTDSGRELVRMAEEELERMSHIVTQTLRFTRPSREPVEADMRELSDSALALFRNRLTSAGIQVTREYGAVEPLLCSAQEVRQVLAALVSNARDAMLRGGRLRVRVREARNAAGLPGVRITVGDTGSGIPMDVRGRMFEPFVTTKDATGTGLGLWMASEIVGRHKGTIAVRSSTTPGRSGTVLSVFVPRP